MTAPPDALPANYGIGSVTRGAECFAAVGGKLDQDGNVAKPSVLLFDLSWRETGEVAGDAIPSGTWWTWAVWDPEGRKLGVLFHDRGNSWTEVVGVLEPPSLRFREVCRDVYKGDTRGLTWAGSGLVLAHSDRLILIDTASGLRRDLYIDSSVPAPRHSFIHSLLASPDGRYVAFDRMPVPRWGSQSGLWMVEVASGKCSEVTREQVGWYCHELLYWDDHGRLLFSRHGDFSPFYSIYRASLQ